MPARVMNLKQAKFVPDPVSGVRRVVGKELVVGVALEAGLRVAFSTGVSGARLTITIRNGLWRVAA